MRTKLLITSLLFGGLSANAQYQKAHDLGADDYANKIIATSEGYILVGSSTSNPGGSYDAALMTADVTGTLQASGGQVGGAGTEFGTSATVTSLGETTIVGRSNSFSTAPANVNDVMVLHLDGQGSPAWIQVLGSDSVDFATNVIEGNDGNIIVVGQSKRRSTNRIDAIAYKLDVTDGSIIWAKEIGSPFINETAYDVKSIGDGYLVVGYSGANIIGFNEGMVVILGEDGSKQFAFLFGGPGDDDVRAFVDGTQGKFFLAGNTRNIGAGSGDAFLARFDVSNQIPSLDWFKTYGSTANESLQTAIKTDDDHVLMVGTTPTNSNGQDAFVIKVDMDGVIQWSNLYGGSGNDFFQGITSDPAGGYVAAGYSNSFGGNMNDVWLVGIDTDGNSGCNESAAGFVEETIDPSVAYMDITNATLDDITSTDVVIAERLANIDFNDNAPSENVLCALVSVDQNDQSTELVAYPNPSASGIFNVNLPANTSFDVTVFDSMGRVVSFMSLTSQTRLTVNLSSFATGVYNLRLIDRSNGSATTTLLVK